MANPVAKTELSTRFVKDVSSSKELALTATMRPPLLLTLQTGANCACDAPNAAEEDNVLALRGTATTDPDTIDVTAIVKNR
jgi:hypothetical protein